MLKTFLGISMNDIKAFTALNLWAIAIWLGASTVISWTTDNGIWKMFMSGFDNLIAISIAIFIFCLGVTLFPND